MKIGRIFVDLSECHLLVQTPALSQTSAHPPVLVRAKKAVLFQPAFHSRRSVLHQKHFSASNAFEGFFDKHSRVSFTRLETLVPPLCQIDAAPEPRF